MNELPEFDFHTLVRLASNPELDENVERAFEFSRQVTVQEPEFIKLAALWIQNGQYLISKSPFEMANIMASMINMAFCFGMIYAQSQKNMLESWSDFWDKLPEDEDNEDEPTQS